LADAVGEDLLQLLKAGFGPDRRFVAAQDLSGVGGEADSPRTWLGGPFLTDAVEKVLVVIDES
jgi:hypothetical protein